MQGLHIFTEQGLTGFRSAPVLTHDDINTDDNHIHNWWVSTWMGDRLCTRKPFRYV